MYRRHRIVIVEQESIGVSVWRTTGLISHSQYKNHSSMLLPSYRRFCSCRRSLIWTYAEKNDYKSNAVYGAFCLSNGECCRFQAKGIEM
mmetsp:Transcript_7125/g.10862  ORF Transcript_7125/g.10862 Transcript_7125/m.10862 type:complete len:89 (-) Transcript_7125:249-515(-)